MERRGKHKQAKKKDPIIAALLSFFLGAIVAGYLYLGRTKRAVVAMAIIITLIFFIVLSGGRLIHEDTENGEINIFELLLGIFPIIMAIDSYRLAQKNNKKIEEEIARQKEEQKRKRNEEKERKKRGFEAKKEKLKDLEHDYIGNFVRKYYTDLKGGSAISDPKLKLKELLSLEGIEVSDGDLDKLISEEVGKYEYKQFREKIISTNPEVLDDYIRAFLEYRGDNYLEDIDKLQKLLVEKLPSVDEINIKKIESVKKEIELERFKKKLIDEDSGSISMHDIDSMSGYDFERFLEKLFRKMGYSVTNTKLTGDQGGDLILSKLGDKIAVQAKRSETPIGNKAIQEVLGAMKMYNCGKGMVVTNNAFTTSARELAIKSNVELVGRTKLKNWIEKWM